MHRISNHYLFNRAQALILDLILEHWSAIRIELLKNTMEQVPLNGAALDKQTLINILVDDLTELSQRRKEMLLVDNARAEELREEIAQGHRYIINGLLANFAF